MSTPTGSPLGNHEIDQHTTAKVRINAVSITERDPYMGTVQTIEVFNKDTARRLAELLLQWADRNGESLL
jgi:hypothetical protein